MSINPYNDTLYFLFLLIKSLHISLFVIILNFMLSCDIMQCTLILVDCCVVLSSLFGGAQDKFWSLSHEIRYVEQELKYR